MSRIGLKDRDRLEANWRQVVDEVTQATTASGRTAGSVRIIGVTKYVDVNLTEALVEVGCRDLGENRPQSLWNKADAMTDKDVRWHLIGHLQRNKLRRTLQYPVLIQSIDSARLIQSLSDELVSLNNHGQAAKVDVLVEVNISGDETKTGMTTSQLREVFQSMPYSHVNILGLMAMAGLGTEPDESRRQFAAVRALRDQLAAEFGLPLTELSMGMSGDFVEAIAEGATMVRIGSRIYEGLLAS
jgi:PLP dependent protein